MGQWEQMFPGMGMKLPCGSVQTAPSLRYVILVAEAAASDGGLQQPHFPSSLICDACFSLPSAVCLAATSIQASGGLSFIQASLSPLMLTGQDHFCGAAHVHGLAVA